MEQRILFPKGLQKKFLNKVKYNLRAPSLRSILQFGFDVPYSTLKKYYGEKLFLPKDLFKNLCRIAKINPKTLNFEYVLNNWGQIIGGKKGIKVIQSRYPKEIKKWRRRGWLNSPVIGVSNLKKVKIPALDWKLAEFIGAYLGDGTLTPYFLRISGDATYDRDYYNYLSRLSKKLFGINPSIRITNNTIHLTIFSKKICSFLNEQFKLRYGDKIRNKTKIPRQIISDNNFAIACLRGLIDTDGSISRRGRSGEQFCIQFTNYDKSLLDQVKTLGKKLKIFTFFEEKGVGTNSWPCINEYFRIVGSSNLKHIIRFDLRLKGVNAYRKDIIPFLEQDLYRNLSLPFKTNPGL